MKTDEIENRKGVPVKQLFESAMNCEFNLVTPSTIISICHIVTLISIVGQFILISQLIFYPMNRL